MWYFRSPEIVFGEDSVSYLSTLDIKKAAIITDRNLLRTEIPGLVKKALPEGADSMVLGDISEEPPLSEMTAHLSRINDFAPDWFLAVGGGSAMDTAKILFALHERPDLSVYDITPLVKLGLGKKSRLVAIPTTSGTGSECTWAAMLTVEDEKRKHELASPEIMPRYAILDPAFVVSLPPEQTRNTASDAIAHSVEAYGSSWHNAFSDAMAEKALELILGGITGVMGDPKNLELRNQVHVGASMAGLAFSNSQIGLVHALGHALGAQFKTPHGKAVALFLPHVVAYNYDACPERYDRLNRIVPEQLREASFSESLENILEAIGQARNGIEAGIAEAEYEANLDNLVELASESTGMVTNPKDAGSPELRSLFMRAFSEEGP
ncbi:MAG TPA: iron-containing alcohol dehydrogenase [Nitrososphaerales archaeon]|nr:iron-containing alcohol dehydrogenase [Nitrososphaerales archaeon]